MSRERRGRTSGERLWCLWRECKGRLTVLNFDQSIASEGPKVDEWSFLSVGIRSLQVFPSSGAVEERLW
jgi:hypothetical protein